MKSLQIGKLLASTLAIGICASSGQSAVSSKSLDLTLGAGYSTNPFLRTLDAQGSFFGRASARGLYSLRGERSATDLTGYVEASTYFNDYGLKSSFAVDGSHSRQVSEKVTVFGSLGASGDIAGQLSNRFLYVPPVVETPTDIPPLPPTVGNENLYSFEGRQYRFYGQAGFSTRLSDRSNLTISGGASRNIFTQPNLRDFTTIFSSAAYGRTLSERTTLGLNLYASRTNYDSSGDHSEVLNPTVSLSTRLSENMEASANAGVTLSKVHNDAGSDSSVDLSFGAHLCRTSETERLCGNVARNSQASPTAAVVTATSAEASWFKKLDEKQTIQLSAGYSRYSGTSEEPIGLNLSTNQLHAAANYSRRINDRLSLGGDAGLRSLRRAGDDPKADLSGSIFVRYRLGDVR